MPKPSLKNPFARRRSSGNVLDVQSPTAEVPAQSSFRVIERPEKSKIVFGEGADGSRLNQVQRPFSSPLQLLKGKSVDDLTYHANGSVDTAASRKAASALKPGRGSGGTTHSGSSEFYQSSSASGRHSSSSTLPSSVDPENDDDELFTKRAPTTAAYKPLPTPIDAPLPPVPSFTARAQRAFSFGLRSKHSQERPIDNPPTPPELATVYTTTQTHPLPNPPTQSRSPTRERALTTSSYASTAVPTRIDTRPDLGAADFGGDFGKMFEPVSSSATVSPINGDSRADSEPLFPPRSYARQDSSSSPGIQRTQSESPFAWERRNSNDALLASATTSPNLNSDEFMITPQTQERRAEESTARLYQLSDPQGSGSSVPSANTSTPTLNLPAGGAVSAFEGVELNPWDKESSSTTPRALKRESILQDDELFDVSPVGMSSRAKRPEPFKVISQPKRMTQTQFKILQSYDDDKDSVDEDAGSGNEYEDDDELERAKQVTKQRRKQEANMAIYRQQMKRVTGGGPTDLPNKPALEARSSSSPSLHLGGMPAAPPADLYRKPVDVDDDDIPLGYLAAQGFPSASKAPTLGDGYRPPSIAPNRSSQLPAFARRLPEDPYFGAGLVQPSQRESLAFGSGGSVYGGNSAPSTPGGLVGIIASEEIQRQRRRGSPNPQTGTYDSMPQMNRTSSMTSLQGGYPQMMGMPGMVPQTPTGLDPQVQYFMQAQAQMMSNMQAIILQQQAQLSQQPAPQGLGMARPMSTVSHLGMQPPQLDQMRSMSMLTPPAGHVPPRPGSSYNPRMSTMAPSISGLPAGYAPSIAPSERSNVGMASRYRPVYGDNSGRTNSMTSQLTVNAFSAQPTTTTERPQSQHLPQERSTIRVIDKPKGASRVSVKPTQNEDDEEGGWADMFKKKLKSKRSERASRTGGERVALSELYPNVEL